MDGDNNITIPQYIAVITPPINLMMVSTSWTGILITLFVMLLFFSNHKMRKSPIFLLNLLSVSLGIALGVVSMITCVSIA